MTDRLGAIKRPLHCCTVLGQLLRSCNGLRWPLQGAIERPLSCCTVLGRLLRSCKAVLLALAGDCHALHSASCLQSSCLCGFITWGGAVSKSAADPLQKVSRLLSLHCNSSRSAPQCFVTVGGSRIVWQILTHILSPGADKYQLQRTFLTGWNVFICKQIGNAVHSAHMAAYAGKGPC